MDSSADFAATYIERYGPVGEHPGGDHVDDRGVVAGARGAAARPARGTAVPRRLASCDFASASGVIEPIGQGQRVAPRRSRRCRPRRSARRSPRPAVRAGPRHRHASAPPAPIRRRRRSRPRPASACVGLAAGDHHLRAERRETARDRLADARGSRRSRSPPDPRGRTAPAPAVRSSWLSSFARAQPNRAREPRRP